MAETSPTVAIYHPRAGDYRYSTSADGTIHLDITNHIWFTLANPRPAMKSDLLAEADAMRKLAEIAAEIAAELERRATERARDPQDAVERGLDRPPRAIDCSPFHGPHSAGCPFCAPAVRADSDLTGETDRLANDDDLHRGAAL